MNPRLLVFNVVAQVTGMPNWAKLVSEGGTLASTFRWTTIPATSTLLAKMDAPNPGGSKLGILAFSSAALNPSTLDLYIMGGGHNDYGGNEVYRLGLNADSPVWTRLSTPSIPCGRDTAYGPDGRPSSRHTARNLHYVPQRNALMTFGAFSVYSEPSKDFPTVDAWDISTNDYVFPSPYPSSPATSQTKAHTVLDQHGNVWQQPQGSTVYKWTQATGAYGAWTTVGTSVNFTQAISLYDSVRDLVIRLPENYSSPIDGSYWSADPGVAFNSTRLRYATPPSGTWTGTAWHDKALDKYFVLRWSWDLAQMYVIDPAQMIANPLAIVATVQSIANAPSLAGDSGYYAFYNRFHYIEALKGYVLMPHADGPVYFMRTS